MVTTNTQLPARGSHLILSDPAAVVSATYGVAFQWPGESSLNRPASLVIDRKGTVRFFYVAGTRPGHHFASTEAGEDTHWSYDRPSADELVRVIDRLDKRAADQEGKLAALRKADVAGLRAALKEEEAYLRAEAARLLAGMGASAEAAVPSLVVALGDPIGFVRSEAAKALGKIG